MAGLLRRTLSVLSSEVASSVRRGVGGTSTRAASLGAWRGFARGADGEDGQTTDRAKIDEDKMIAEMENEVYIFDTVGCENPALELMNACLSDATKEKMYAMHQEDKNTWTSKKLSEHFKIREQRAIAILALKDMEKKAEAAGEELFDSAQQIVEEFYGARDEGTGEMFTLPVVKYPRYRVLGENEVPSPQSPAAQEAKRLEQDQVMINEFSDRLARNMQVVGSGLRMVSRTKEAAKKPEEGWSLVIEQLGENAGEPYVALPDGGKRELRADEQTFYDARNFKRKKKGAAK
mmetsp:Transcript_14512/g.31062  ORF Transcript_14512/g.31062 Transcript_14512/m.31062 type:complete len:291 (-) Transcript_14512:326-1198(-)|eukprot:CAMPEP_0118935432 /NCGR_PEP_ID=MMETSP1169-20130426/15641_1 /TAXON_ID=36882 /ORGANISM="Pyramimonas obovata, Strain CCMP722" /LENGTH=290 /DNA_ID=CAMNT_0006878473 /DNA_START=145 /DNA_END=1017 /DNA_ORIENTATION=-